METDPFTSPLVRKTSLEPDWRAGPGTAGVELLPWHEAEPADRGTMELRHRLMHGARLGIDIGGVMMRIGETRKGAASALVRRIRWP